MDRELLIEIGLEELPAAWMPGLTRQLAERVEAQLKEHRLAPGAPIETFSTPRRLTARLAKIAERQEDLEEVVTGPPVSAAFNASGEATPAAIGFAKKQGVTVGELARTPGPKGEYLTFLKRVRGKSAIDTLPDILGGVLRSMAFPKQMRWDATLDDGRTEFVFGRPVRWLLFLYGGRVVPFTIGRPAHAAGPLVQEIASGALTYGHRFLATSGRAGRSIKVRSFDEYQARLREHFIVLEHSERRDRIARELEGHARRLNGRVLLKDHHALIDEVADLVEFPGVVAGFFDPAFLALPQEVLATTLVHHQHYFPVLAEDGGLKEAFLAVVNTQPKDERLIAKNAERVVTARLRDARFFWESDRKVPLEARLERLHTLQFHKKLGSYRDKAERIERLAEHIAREAFMASPARAASAAKAGRLAKADLTSDMVFEFPELQGTMGGIYAREQGQPEEVWKAIYHHYLPIAVEPDAPPPREALGAAAVTWAAVSMADKLDTVVGLLYAGERATGSRDPFGLRRQMHGIIRILMDLPELAGIDRELSFAPLAVQARAAFAGAEGADSLSTFAAERVRFALEQRGFDVRVARAVTASADVIPLRARRLARAIQDMRTSEDFLALAVLFKRVKNISPSTRADGARSGQAPSTGADGARSGQAPSTGAEGARTAQAPSTGAEGARSGQAPSTGAEGARSGQATERAGEPLDRAALTEPAELALLAELDARRPAVAAAAAAADYIRAFTEIAALRPVVDRFFIEVFVMAEDVRVRTARLTLMANLRDLILDLADISEIVPQTE